jgi:hypothetical protein
MTVTLPKLPNGHLGLQSDQIYYFPLEGVKADGTFGSLPPGDVVTASSTGDHAASLTWAVTQMPADAPNPGAPALSATPMVAQSDDGNGGGGIGLQMSDTSGLPENQTTASYQFDIIQDQASVSEGIDIDSGWTVAQPTPSNPGP